MLLLCINSLYVMRIKRSKGCYSFIVSSISSNQSEYNIAFLQNARPEREPYEIKVFYSSIPKDLILPDGYQLP